MFRESTSSDRRSIVDHADDRMLFGHGEERSKVELHCAVGNGKRYGRSRKKWYGSQEKH